jgi:AcrR family transcriptional regulator
MTTELSRRAELRLATIAEIKALARQQLTEHGPGGLSLRAIARQMRMASSALYRYYTSANELITALVVDAYDSLADALTAARDTHPADDPTGQWWAICHAYRRWALGHRSDFALIFGTPVPGYQAPDEVTGPAAGRSSALVLTAYAAGVSAGAADPERSHVPPTIQAGDLLPALLAGNDFPPRLVAITLAAYTSLLGYLTIEIFGSLTRLVADPTQLYDAHVRTVMLGMGFDPTLVTGLSASAAQKRSR